MRSFFIFMALVSSPVAFAASVVQNGDLTLEFQENRVKVKADSDAGKVFDISQPKEGETLVRGQGDYLLQVKTIGDDAFVSEAFLKLDKKSGAYKLERDRFTKVRMSDQKVYRVVLCSELSVKGNTSIIPQARQNRYLDSDGCTTVDSHYCASIQRRGSWDWKGGQGTEKISGFPALKKKLDACEELNESVRASMGNRWSNEKTVKDQIQEKEQLLGFVDTVVTRYFPSMHFNAHIISNPGKELKERTESPFASTAHELRHLGETLDVCEELGAQMIVPEGSAPAQAGSSATTRQTGGESAR